MIIRPGTESAPTQPAADDTKKFVVFLLALMIAGFIFALSVGGAFLASMIQY